MRMKFGAVGRIIGQVLGGVAGLLRSRHYVVVGESMRPALAHRQHVQTRPLTRRSGPRAPARGDIVAFRHPLEPGRVYIKRIVGLPNEHIALAEGQVVIDGLPQAEPYLLPGPPARPRYASQWFTGDDEYFLLGDNRADSEDSRTFGPVPGCRIVGRVWFSYWPVRVWPSGSRPGAGDLAPRQPVA